VPDEEAFLTGRAVTTVIVLGVRGSCDFAQDDNVAVILREVAGSTPADTASPMVPAI
jgi:hypothetical protein